MNLLPFYPNQHDHFHNLTVHSYDKLGCYVPILVQDDNSYRVYGLLKMFLNHKSTSLDVSHEVSCSCLLSS